MYRKATFLLLGLLLCLGGCGLIPIPYSRSLPGEVQDFRVVDISTGKDILDASVSVEITRFENWVVNFPPVFSNTENEFSFSEPIETLKVNRLPDHSFQIQPVKRTAFAKPWGIGPLGTTIHSDFGTTITVVAPGFNRVILSYYPETNLRHQDTWVAEDGSQLRYSPEEIYIFELTQASRQSTKEQLE